MPVMSYVFVFVSFSFSCLFFFFFWKKYYDCFCFFIFFFDMMADEQLEKKNKHMTQTGCLVRETQQLYSLT